MRSLTYALVMLCIINHAQATPCTSASDTNCLTQQIETLSKTIPEESWRNKVSKELATSIAIEGDLDRSLAMIQSITNGDTQAMTIRAIGMALATQQDRYDNASYTNLFNRLEQVADTIEHDGARGIAYTYIAMSQAFAGLDEAATKTAKSMENSALRNKAFGETAEIQAERGDLSAAMDSISHIDSLAFRNKAFGIIGNILMKEQSFDKALVAFQAIDNPTRKAQYLQKLLTAIQKEKTTPLSTINKRAFQ